MVFIGGPDDGVITPWQSRCVVCVCVCVTRLVGLLITSIYSHFGFYKENSASEITTMTEQEVIVPQVLCMEASIILVQCLHHLILYLSIALCHLILMKLNRLNFNFLFLFSFWSVHWSLQQPLSNLANLKPLTKIPSINKLFLLFPLVLHQWHVRTPSTQQCW